jgi:DNA-binding GntR family transcriptional regulator
LWSNAAPLRAREPGAGDACVIDDVTLSRQAYYTIRDRILRGEIRLGAPLSRRRLAAQLGMSFIPVGEALRSLEKDGLVESRPRVATRVCLPTPEEIRERYEIHEAIEAQAARLYAVRAAGREKRELEAIAERLDLAFRESAAAYDTHNQHLDFHLAIAEVAGCRALRDEVERQHVVMFRWRFGVALPARCHRDLIAALNKGDAAVADEAARAHVRHGMEQVIRALGPRSEGLRFARK